MIRSHDNNISRISPCGRLKNPKYIIKKISSCSVIVKVLIIASLNSFVHISQPAIKRNLQSIASQVPCHRATWLSLWYLWAFHNRWLREKVVQNWRSYRKRQRCLDVDVRKEQTIFIPALLQCLLKYRIYNNGTFT